MQAMAKANAHVKSGKDPRRGSIAGFFGQSGVALPGPQAFLVEMPEPGATVKPHFHPVRQFQVIARGGGRLGKKPLSRLTFHYADPNTPYGPIVADDEGIAFFTLRPEYSPAIHYMPGSREKMGGKAGRNFAQRFAFDSCEVHPDGAVQRETLIERTEDGLQAEGLHLGPNASAEGLDPKGSGGQYYLVADGSLLHGDGELPADSLLWIGPDEPTPSLRAGAAGAHVLLMRFPVGAGAQTTANSGS